MPTITVDDEALAVIREAVRDCSRHHPDSNTRSIAFDICSALMGGTARATDVTVEVRP